MQPMIDLRIHITEPAVAQMKLRLAKALPHVKSSHRVEALARALGFHTYAALRQAASSTDSIVRVDATAFCAYLGEHRFTVHGVHLYRAAATVAVSSVMDATPKLSAWGYGIGRFRRQADGTRETPQERNARFLEQRAYLLGDNALDQFLLALGLVQRIPTTKTIRNGTGSYRLKHIAENNTCALPCGRLIGRSIDMDYVANGVLVAAALHAGFKAKTHIDELGYESVNVTFNMSKPAIDDLDCRVRPNGARAQDRRRMAELRGRRSGHGAL
jgi:hypothetical protein